MAEQTNVTIRLEFGVEEKALLLDVSSLLYDFELLYDFLVLSTLEEYKEYRFSQYFWYRNGRPLEDFDRLRLVEIRKSSPLILCIGIGAFVLSQILLPLFTIFERISDRKLNRQKLELEVEKLGLDVEAARRQRYLTLSPKNDYLIEEGETNLELDPEELERIRLRTLNSLIRRLERSSIKLNDVSVTPSEDKKEQDEGK